LKKNEKECNNISRGIKMSITFTTDNFESEALQSPIPVLVDFWAPWCGPCKVIGPIIEEIAGEYEGSVKVGKINVDDEPALAEKYGITSIPTLIVFKDGQLTVQKSGAAPKNDIVALFKNLI
jgi:thioredoxin 1